jgi:hypothetical protein
LRKNENCFQLMTGNSKCIWDVPVGPAPRIRTSAPTGRLSLSAPWTAHAAGSTKVASSSVRLNILYTFLLALFLHKISRSQGGKCAYTVT